MAFRKFNTDTWDDPWFETLTIEQRYLFIYLWTNSRCNQAGMYEISIAKISKDTMVPPCGVEPLMVALQWGVSYYPDHNVVFVKNFLKHQCQNASFAQSALSLVLDNFPELAQDFVNANLTLLKKYGVEIPKLPTNPPPTPHGGTTNPPPCFTEEKQKQNRTEAEKKEAVGVLASGDAQPPSVQPSCVQSKSSPGLFGDDFLEDFGCEDLPPKDEQEEPTFLVYPCIQGKNKSPKEYRLSEATVQRWESLPEFAAMDVRAVLRKAHEHVQIPTNRKTAPRMEAWLYKIWICRDLEKGQYPRRDGGSSMGRASPTNGGYRYRGTEQSINSPEHKQRLIDMNVLG